jgi:hypothetical protein
LEVSSRFSPTSTGVTYASTTNQRGGQRNPEAGYTSELVPKHFVIHAQPNVKLS